MPRGPWPLVLDLMREQPLLHQAALSTTLVVESMFTPLTSTIALAAGQMGANVSAGGCGRAWTVSLVCAEVLA